MLTRTRCFSQFRYFAQTSDQLRSLTALPPSPATSLPLPHSAPAVEPLTCTFLPQIPKQEKKIKERNKQTHQIQDFILTIQTHLKFVAGTFRNHASPFATAMQGCFIASARNRTQKAVQVHQAKESDTLSTEKYRRHILIQPWMFTQHRLQTYPLSFTKCTSYSSERSAI